MYVPNFNFHFTLESSVQKEAMQAKKKKLQWLRQTTYDNFKAPSNVQSALQGTVAMEFWKWGLVEIKSQH